MTWIDYDDRDLPRQLYDAIQEMSPMACGALLLKKHVDGKNAYDRLRDVLSDPSHDGYLQAVDIARSWATADADPIATVTQMEVWTHELQRGDILKAALRGPTD